MAPEWNALADSLASDPEHRQQIAIARLDCEQQEDLCTYLGVDKTPTTKVYFKGTEQMTYKTDFYHIDMLRPFITKMASKLYAEGGAADNAAADDDKIGNQKDEVDEDVYCDDDYWEEGGSADARTNQTLSADNDEF